MSVLSATFSASPARYQFGTGSSYTDPSNGNVWNDGHSLVSGAYRTLVVNRNIGGSKTLDPIYQSEIYGEDFEIEVPVQAGVYDIHLHLAELWFVESGKRLFDVTLEGVPLLTDFDLFAEAGRWNVAFVFSAERQLILDGAITLGFAEVVNSAKINGLEVIPVTNDPNPPPTPSPPAVPFDPIRINVGGPRLAASDGSVWNSDSYFNGGDTYRTDDPNQVIDNTADEALFRTERYCDPCTYSIPLPHAGLYRVSLYLAEIFTPAGLGKREINVVLENGETWLSRYDIVAEAPGQFRAKVESRVIEVTDGMLDMEFERRPPVIYSPKISAIKVEKEGDNSDVYYERVFFEAATICGTLEDNADEIEGGYLNWFKDREADSGCAGGGDNDEEILSFVPFLLVEARVCTRRRRGLQGDQPSLGDTYSRIGAFQARRCWGTSCGRMLLLTRTRDLMMDEHSQDHDQDQDHNKNRDQSSGTRRRMRTCSADLSLSLRRSGLTRVTSAEITTVEELDCSPDSDECANGNGWSEGGCCSVCGCACTHPSQSLCEHNDFCIEEAKDFDRHFCADYGDVKSCRRGDGGGCDDVEPTALTTTTTTTTKATTTKTTKAKMATTTTSSTKKPAPTTTTTTTSSTTKKSEEQASGNVSTIKSTKASTNKGPMAGGGNTSGRRCTDSIVC